MSEKEKLVTTGEAARLCSVDPRTIARWTDAGLIKAHRTAGGRRRLDRSELLAFMRAQGMPVPGRIHGGDQARIAVVDDDPVVVRALSRALKRVVPGADCRTASDGFAAGLLLASFQPDLVLLDVVMPGMSGVEVCAHIRAAPQLAGAAILAVSGHLTSSVREQLLAAGANGFLAKPFDPHVLEATVVELLNVTTRSRRAR